MQNERLVISGSRFDIITHASHSWNESDLITEPDIQQTVLSACLEAIEELVRRKCSVYRSPSEMDDALWRTPIFDMESGVFSSTGRQLVRATGKTRAGYEAVRYPNTFVSISEEDKRQQKASYFLYQTGFLYALCNRRIFVTAKGYVGTGPVHLQAGDHVCVL